MPEPDEVNAYTEFIATLCRMSKEQKRIRRTERPTGNDKFTFRVFLIRLDVIGEEFKTTRHILLRNLPWNSAWRNGAPKKEVEADECYRRMPGLLTCSIGKQFSGRPT